MQVLFNHLTAQDRRTKESTNIGVLVLQKTKGWGLLKAGVSKGRPCVRGCMSPRWPLDGLVLQKVLRTDLMGEQKWVLLTLSHWFYWICYFLME